MVFEVLITGFGPFASFKLNPSWLAVKGLHGTYHCQGKLHVQCLQVPVCYSAVLDTIPRLYGLQPSSRSAKPWLDPNGDLSGAAGDGSPYPCGYQVQHPSSGYDLILHVGVGKAGGIECETQAHKSGYRLRDSNKSLAPLISAGRHGQTIEQVPKQDDSGIRGFGQGYEDFEEIEKSLLNVDNLVQRLNTIESVRGLVTASIDPGRFLCDFIYYCSLAEGKRAGGGKTPCVFIHIPPIDQPLSTEACSEAIKEAILFLAKSLGHFES
ncbi:peptidase C15, pyroglutamyl peptidase I-like protein [Violaceomyces palustris]|uniref:Peptidase C15, pyroglutamyl peptidase I-like protein n=1 Tax=Violaceomyces palustris TaxID=1673888 RepID=A0ACD0P0A8_9BASI|nr:peptidase C15, pyroglutamyl peptidase I-like protein [Violaceomyces palustris]